MKHVLKKWLTKGYPLRDYFPVANIDDNQHVNVIAHLPSGVNLNVTDQQWTLAYNPLMIGILMPKEMENELRKASMQLKYHWSSSNGTVQADKLSEIDVQYEETIDITFNDSVLILFKATRARNFQLSLLRRAIILYKLYTLSKKRAKYFNTLSFDLYRQYVAQFTYPRKVMMIAVEHQGTSHFFPVDLQGRISTLYFFGLRHSNRIISILQQIRKVVICFVPASEHKTLYYLANFLKNQKSHQLFLKKPPFRL